MHVHSSDLDLLFETHQIITLLIRGQWIEIVPQMHLQLSLCAELISHLDEFGNAMTTGGLQRCNPILNRYPAPLTYTQLHRSARPYVQPALQSCLLE